MDEFDWKHILFAFEGRINRGKFWLGAAVIWVVVTLALFIAVAVNSPIGWLLFVLAYTVAFWAGLSISIKRWHDRDKSGWWILIGLVPVIGGLWALIETGFLEGTKGDNTYGPDPLAGH